MRKYLIVLGLLAAPSIANAEWHEATSNHFVVYADAKADWVRDYAETLERFDSGSRRLRNLPDDKAPGANRVTVYIVPATEFPALAPKGAGGFYRPAASDSSIFIPDRGRSAKSDSTLMHEYTHHLLATAWSSIAVPGWLNEGMAQAQSTAEFRSDGSIVFGRELKNSGWMLSDVGNSDVRYMVTKSTAPTMDSVYYSGGWLLSHMLTFDNRRAGQLVDYVVAVNQGKSTEDAATEAFGDLQSLTSDLQAYKRRSSLPGVVVPASEISVGPIAVRALTAGEQATIRLAMRSRAGVSAQEAQQIYADAKLAAAPYPDDAGAQRMLAEAAYDADDFEAAKSAADRALAADPQRSGALLYKVKAMMELGAAAAAQRDAIEDGLALAPNDAALLELYFQTFGRGGEAPTLLAKQRLLQAYKISPQDGGVRMAAGFVLLADGNAKDAQAVLRPLAYSVHRNPAADRALAAIEALQSGNTQDALAALTALPAINVEISDPTDD